MMVLMGSCSPSVCVNLQFSSKPNPTAFCCLLGGVGQGGGVYTPSKKVFQKSAKSKSFCFSTWSLRRWHVFRSFRNSLDINKKRQRGGRHLYVFGCLDAIFGHGIFICPSQNPNNYLYIICLNFVFRAAIFLVHVLSSGTLFWNSPNI